MKTTSEIIETTPYSTAIGVPEMWRIDRSRKWVQVGILTTGEYQFKTFTGNEIIISSTFPGLSLTAAQVLRAKR